MDEINNAEERFVAFIDILGFSAALNDCSPERHAVIQGLFKLLSATNRESAAVYDEQNKLHLFGAGFYSFSDSILIASPSENPPSLTIEKMFQSTHGLASEVVALCLENGFLCRGAIAFGKYFNEGNVGFGVPQVEAVKCESEVANHPRIILTNTCLDAVHKNSLASDKFRRDNDGIYYLDWFHKFLVHRYDVKQMKEHVHSNLKGHNIKTFQKWAWMANYLNIHLDKLGELKAFSTIDREALQKAIELPHGYK